MIPMTPSKAKPKPKKLPVCSGSLPIPKAAKVALPKIAMPPTVAPTIKEIKQAKLMPPEAPKTAPKLSGSLLKQKVEPLAKKLLANPPKPLASKVKPSQPIPMSKPVTTKVAVKPSPLSFVKAAPKAHPSKLIKPAKAKRKPLPAFKSTKASNALMKGFAKEVKKAPAPTKPRAKLPPLKRKAFLPTTRSVPVAPAPKQPLEGEVLEARNFQLTNKEGQAIWLDDVQQEAVDMAVEGKDFCLTGKAGTGKTTTNQAIMLNIIEHHADRLRTVSYRVVGGQGARSDNYSIAVVSFTNRATNNMRRALMSNPELAALLRDGLNITTVHNLLEYTREERFNEELQKMTMQYIPTKNKNAKIDITHLIIEEGTLIAMAVDRSLGNELLDALPDNIQMIVLGDINQLPSIGGKGLLNYALTQAPVVELQKVHRQALDNPIIRQALRCIDGKELKTDMNDKGLGVRVLSVKKGGHPIVISGQHMKLWLHSLFSKLIGTPDYDHEKDIILIPYNKSEGNNVGTEDMNASIATLLAKSHERKVFEIIANYKRIYLSEGDRVYVNKMEGIVQKIAINMDYLGKEPQEASIHLNYYGVNESLKDVGGEDFDIGGVDLTGGDFNYSELDIDALGDDDENDKATRKASHIVTIDLEDGREVTLDRAGDYDPAEFSLGYALTVHKAQGSEWPRVYFVLHDCHKVMKFRELVYTAMTRPKENLIIISQPSTLKQAVENPRIKGTTLAEKIEFFNGGYLDASIKVFPRQRGSSHE